MARWVPDPLAWEISWTASVGGWPRSIGLPLEIAMQAGSRWMFVITAALLAGLGRVRLGANVLAACALAWIASRLLKDVFDRQRPTATQFGRALRESAGTFSFPSSHASIAAALVVSVLAVAWAGRRPPPIAVVAGVVVVVAVCLGRLYVGAHWPLDVVSGVVLGSATPVLMAWSVAVLGRRFTRSRAAET